MLIYFCFVFAGERSQDKEDLLQIKGVQKAHPAQGHPVQEGERQLSCSRKAPL